MPVAARDRAGIPVRSGGLPSIAVDDITGDVHVAWEDGAPSGGRFDAIAMSSSRDGGQTWSPPARVNQDERHDAFTPSLTASNGAITLTYYDTRADDDAPSGAFLVNAWIATSRDGGATWDERALTEPFDLRPALIAGSYFLGDYQGLATAGASVVAFFTAGGAGAKDPTDVYILPPGK